MSESDDTWRAGKINRQQYIDFLTFRDNFLVAVGELAAAASDGIALVDANVQELSGDEFDTLKEQSSGTKDLIDAKRLALDAFASWPEIGYELFGLSHTRRRSKRVESRQ